MNEMEKANERIENTLEPKKSRGHPGIINKYYQNKPNAYRYAAHICKFENRSKKKMEQNHVSKYFALHTRHCFGKW